MKEYPLEFKQKEREKDIYLCVLRERELEQEKSNNQKEINRKERTEYQNMANSFGTPAIINK